MDDRQFDRPSPYPSPCCIPGFALECKGATANDGGAAAVVAVSPSLAFMQTLRCPHPHRRQNL